MDTICGNPQVAAGRCTARFVTSQLTIERENVDFHFVRSVWAPSINPEEVCSEALERRRLKRR